MATRLFAEFKDKEEFKMYYESMLNSIPKKYHFDFTVFVGRLESTLITGKEQNNDNTY